jgi:hypothetical protein
MRRGITITREVAFAAGHDAGNRHMRRAGRSKWNRRDRDAAVEETNRLLALVPVEQGGTLGLNTTKETINA